MKGTTQLKEKVRSLQGERQKLKRKNKELKLVNKSLEELNHIEKQKRIRLKVRK